MDGVINNMKDKFTYSKCFVSTDKLYDKREYELLKDCFNFAIDQVNISSGLLVLYVEDGYVILVYDFKSKSYMYQYQGKKIIYDYEKDANICFYSKEVIDEGRSICILNFIANEKISDNVNKLLDKVSNIMKNIFKISQKYSRYGEMVLKALDNVNDSISYCDKDGYVKYANKSCFKVLETNKQELFKKHLSELTIGKPMLLEILKNKKSIVDVEYFIKYNGKKFHFINSGYPVYSDDGKVIGAIDIFRSMERSRRFANNIAGYRAFFTFDDLIGQSIQMLRLIDRGKKFAKSDETILILGESGTGKELIAQSIHNYSSRSKGPFIALNCANFPNELIDSELFGYEEGAFTGARKGGKQGKFELASGGTLFLDEIGEMQIHLQAKLLRVLETMCITRIGGNSQVKLDVRIIAATNRKLERLVEEGKFRRDLYYRLKVLCIVASPLRERKEDIILLARYFIEKISKKSGKRAMDIEDSAIEILLNYSWPGNVRELENLISRIIFLCEGNKITEKTLYDAGMQAQGYDEIIKRNIIKIDKKILTDMMSKMGGNKKKTAEALGISRPTLYKMLKKYDVK